MNHFEEVKESLRQIVDSEYVAANPATKSRAVISFLQEFSTYEDMINNPEKYK